MKLLRLVLGRFLFFILFYNVDDAWKKVRKRAAIIAVNGEKKEKQ